VPRDFLAHAHMMYSGFSNALGILKHLTLGFVEEPTTRAGGTRFHMPLFHKIMSNDALESGAGIKRTYRYYSRKTVYYCVCDSQMFICSHRSNPKCFARHHAGEEPPSKKREAVAQRHTAKMLITSR
jgi:hypothetical protein